MGQSLDERRRKDREQKRERYANDPEYRERKRAANRAYARHVREYDPEKARDYHRERQDNDPAYVARRRQASKEWKARHVARMSAIIQEAKDRPCVDCGKQYHQCCMEFDHVRSVKLFNISKSARRGRTEKELRDEIAKCDIRCVLCHRLRHFCAC